VKYYLIAGEASGDLHGSNLMKAIKKNDPDAEFRYLGGDLMQLQGGSLLKHFREMPSMGFDVLMHLRTVLKNMKSCKLDILQWQPDVLILIDYAGFNLRIAKFAHKNKIKVFYYISPKVWAWHESRVKKLKLYIDKLFVIFPFEIEYFRKFQIEAEYFGNPLIDSTNDFKFRKEEFKSFKENNKLDNRPILALLPGSRKGEINRILPVMIKAVKDLKEFQILIAGSQAIKEKLYNKIIKNNDIKIVFGQTYNLVSHARLAVVTSGTATLETALLKTPEVVVFKTTLINYLIGKSLVKIHFFSLVNLIKNREVVKEFLQLNLLRKIKTEVEKLLHDNDYRQSMLKDFDEIESMLGQPGVSDRIAKRMTGLLKTELK